MGKRTDNIYRRGETFYGRLTVAGKEHRWSLRTGDAAIARRRVTEERKRLIAEAHYGEKKHKYTEVVEEWARNIHGQIGPQTARRYGVSLKQLNIELGTKFIDEIDKTTIKEIVTRRRGEGVSIATVRRDLTALSSVLEFAEDQDYREGNPALARLRKLTERRDPIVLPARVHIEQVAKIATPMIGAMIRAALATGCRQDELVRAERRNLDLDRRQLTVRGKGNKTRTIDVDAATCAMLAKLPVYIGSKFLFWVDDGKPLKWIAGRFRDAVAAAQKAAHASDDFRPFTFHSLRHRHAVDWLKNGGTIHDLQHRLGHTSIATTEIYTRFLTADEVRRAKGAKC